MRRIFKYTLLFTFLLIFIINATGCSEKSGNPEDIHVDAEVLSASDGKVNVSLTVVNNSLQELAELSCHIYLVSEGGTIAAKEDMRIVCGIDAGGNLTHSAQLEYIGQGTPSVRVQPTSVTFASSAHTGASLRGNAAFLAVAIVAFALALASAALLVFAIHSKNDSIRLVSIIACAVSLCAAVVTFFTYALGAPFITLGIIVGVAGIVLAAFIVLNTHMTINAIDDNLPVAVFGCAIMPILSSVLFGVALPDMRALVAGIGVMIAAVVVQIYVISLNSTYYEQQMLGVSAPITEALYASAGLLICYHISTDLWLAIFIGSAMAFLYSMILCGFDRLKTPVKVIMASSSAALAVASAIVANLTHLWLAVAFIGALVLVFGTVAFFIRFFSEVDYEGLQGFAPPAIVSGLYTLAIGICCHTTGTFLFVASMCSFGVAVLGAACYVLNYFYEKAKHGKIPKKVYYRVGKIATECFYTAQITGISAVIFGLMLGAVFIALYLVI